MLESTGYLSWFLVNLQSKFLELDTQMNGFPSSQMHILVEDGDHQTVLHLNYATCSHNLEISDLVITDSLNIRCMVSCLDDMHFCTSYATVCTSINEGTGFVSSVIAHSVCTVSVGLTGLIYSVL